MGPGAGHHEGLEVNVKAWKSRVAGLGCILCRYADLGETPANLHHVREGQGMSQRASDWLVIPLCREHHQGNTGIHGGKFYHHWKMDEMDLLAMTIEAAVKYT
jgi:hypothetical protein